MKGDFTRSTFNRARHYSGVRMQQGRVQLDADWNEQVDIQTYLDQTEAIDVIGACGVPKIGGGFEIAAKTDGTDFTISAGRIYVDGILCENEDQIDFAQQADLPGAQPIGANGTYLAYLDVWQRHITALEDPAIRETALGGPDTATRTRTTWQVQLLQLGDENAGLTCKTLPDWVSIVDPDRGKLSARAQPEQESPDPCIVEPGAGYRRLENQLYRIEIHADSHSGQATFKWSRDNGSIVTKWISQNGDDLTVGSIGRDKTLGFATGQWVELTDDTRDLLHQPGTLVQLLLAEGDTLTINPATATGSTDIADFSNNPKIRRWDMTGTTGALNVEVPATNDGWIPIEDGVEIKFDMSGEYRTGDYWLIPARTANANIEWPFTDPQAPQGITHHYCALAVITYKGAPLQDSDIEDCRDKFPSLTTICAEDVCYDNSACDLPDVETVQEALDQLCKERDLRFHNKHLHGWGIVCGLEVVCGPTDPEGQREQVLIKQGYAIDCDGNDILLDADEPFPLMDVVRQQGLIDPGKPGEVCLTLERDPEQARRYGVEKYDPGKDNLQSLLSGTLLLDFYNDCIKNIADFLHEEFTPPENEKGLPAGPVTQRVTAFTNLVAQPVNPQAGQNIFISQREDEIIHKFYDDLRAILQSETFCAMFDNARPYPDYPFKELGMDTIFSKGNHVRLRLRPGGREAYSVGPGLNPLKPATIINRFDLQKRVLVSQINPLTGAEGTGTKGDAGTGAVQDVAFSPDGKRIFVIVPTKDGANTFFRAGDIAKDSIKWGPLATICGVKLVTLATTRADSKFVYAIGQGAGLYRIDPDAVDQNMSPLVAFNAVGQLRIDADGRAFATAAAVGASSTVYSLIVRVKVPGGARDADIDLKATGSDDIAIYTKADGAERETIYTIVGPSNSVKSVLAHDLNSGAQIAQVTAENTTIRLEAYAPTNMLLLTSEDGYCLRMLDMSKNRPVTGYLLPMQVGPIAVDADARTEFAYVLNFVSNTVTVVPGKLLDPKFRFPFEQLAQYRKAVIEAFADLLAGFLQYLKDCLCDHFLVKCPECAPDDKIYLACVTIRNDQVYKVCNFSKRRYVKSFPTVGYWLSLVPIMPLIDRVIEEFCCLILPDLFGRFKVADYNEAQAQNPEARVKVGGLRQSVFSMQNANLVTQVRTFMGKGQVMARLFGENLSQPKPPRETAQASLASTAIIDQPVDQTEIALKDQGVEVQRVAYDPAHSPDVTGFLRTPAPGSKVTLYEDAGRVKYYAVSDAVTPQAVDAKVMTLSRTVETREADLQVLQSKVNAQETQLAEVATLKATLADTQGLLTQRDAQIAALSNQLKSLEQRQVNLESNVTSAKMAEMSTMLTELQTTLRGLTGRETARPRVGPHEWLVFGQVLDEAGKPAAGLTVRVFDRDRKYDDLLGETATDDLGDFSVIYHERDFAEIREQLPELYVTVEDAAGNTLYTSRESLRFNAGRAEYFSIRLGGPPQPTQPAKPAASTQKPQSKRTRTTRKTK